MSNKYLEKIASFKGFQANRLGFRDMADAAGLSRKELAENLLRIRGKAKAVGNVELEPGVIQAATNLKRAGSSTDLSRRLLEESFPKGMNSMYRMEL